MPPSIFESADKQPKEKKLPISISQDLEGAISYVKSELQMKAPDMKFNVNSICVDALSKAVKRAKKELAGM